ncbi:MAG: hypothetical protein KA146_05460 [Leptospiraceae bacterium]|nr:hypothetical protein [Leptospiraceae bacterium]
METERDLLKSFCGENKFIFREMEVNLNFRSGIYGDKTIVNYSKNERFKYSSCVIYSKSVSEDIIKKFISILSKFENLILLEFAGSYPFTKMPTISSLKNLRILNFDITDRGNKLSELSEDIGKIQLIRRMYIECYDLKKLPKSFEKLNKITQITFWTNLEKLPTEICLLKNLKKLDVNGVDFIHMPSEIQNLKKIKKIKIRSSQSNKFFHIAKEMCLLSSLVHLDIDCDHFDKESYTFLNNINKLINLKILKINNWNIFQLPDGFGSIETLEELVLDIHTLESLPPSLHTFKNLKKLKVWSGKLTLISDTISDLSKLEELEISHSNLKDLPNSIHTMKNLKQLKIDSKELDPILSAILNKPAKNPEDELRIVQEVQGYLKKREFETLLPLHEAKILIVGEGGSGKTTLLQKMLDLNYEVPNPNEDATIGINCRRNFEFSLDGNKFKANIWDFGGQEIQNLIHKSFLSNNALYILVADNRSQNTNFEFWLKVFNMHKEGSRLLILFNNKNSILLPNNYHPEKYKNQFEDVDLNPRIINLGELEPYTNIQLLFNEIYNEILSVGLFKVEIPSRWVYLKIALSERVEKKISIDEYYEIAKNQEISDDNEANQVLEIFNTIGILTHYKEITSLKNYVFLDPQWLSNALYIPFQDDEIQKSRGIVKTAILEKHWKKKNFKRDDYTLFLSILEKDGLDILFDYKSSESKMIPALIPYSSKDLEWNINDNLWRRFLFKDSMDWIMEKLIVRVHQILDFDNMYRNIFKVKDSNTFGIIQKQENFIEVKTRGEKKLELLEIIQREINNIANKNSNVKDKNIVEQFACPCAICVENQNKKEPYFFDSELLNQLPEEVSFCQCLKSGKLLEIEKLKKRIFKEYFHANTNINQYGQRNIAMKGNATYSEES